MRRYWQPMTQKENKELVEFLGENNIAEFELERGDFKIHIRSAQGTVAAGTAAPTAAWPGSTPVSAPLATAPTAASEEGFDIIKSPIVGTFYEALSPGAPAFVKQGDTVAVGQVLCIVEAMKLMNEIESEAAGQIVKVLVSNGQPVEYGQPLFKIRIK